MIKLLRITRSRKRGKLLKRCALLVTGTAILCLPFLNVVQKTRGIRASIVQSQFRTTAFPTSYASKIFGNADDNTSISTSSQDTGYFAATIRKLVSSNISYYVYSNPNLTLPVIREKAMFNAQKTWTQKWGERFADYSVGEIRWLNALENHPLRTQDASAASIIVVPIPIGATFFWGHDEDRTRAFAHLLEREEPFQQYPEKHVFIAITEKLFVQFWGLPPHHLAMLKPTTVVRDSSERGLSEYLSNHGLGQWCEGKRPRGGYLEDIYFSHNINLGYSQEGALPRNAFHTASYQRWRNSTNYFFYHSRLEPSSCNSTMFRHALLENDLERSKGLLQPSSIGFDIPYHEWRREFTNSKFCLVIRGDQPGSRSLFRAIRAGCMPLIVADTYPAFQPMYTSILNFDDFALIVREDVFIKDPTGSLNDAVRNLSEAETRRKLDGVALMQRIIAADRPNSLFVPAIMAELTKGMHQ